MTVATKTITVIIIEDFKLTRVGLRCALNSNDDINVIAECENANEGLELIKSKNPDVVLMDLGLPGMNGIEATIKTKEISPKTKIPRTIKRFCGLMGQLLQKYRIRAMNSSEVLIKIIKNPITQYIPFGCPIISTNEKSKVVK